MLLGSIVIPGRLFFNRLGLSQRLRRTRKAAALVEPIHEGVIPLEASCERLVSYLEAANPHHQRFSWADGE